MSLQRKDINEAITKARQSSKKRRFEQTFELAINLRELDMKRPENRINLRVQLPNGIGGQKVLVFAGGDLALRARRSGADEVIEPTELNELAKSYLSAARASRVTVIPIGKPAAAPGATPGGSATTVAHSAMTAVKPATPATLGGIGGY